MLIDPQRVPAVPVVDNADVLCIAYSKTLIGLLALVAGANSGIANATAIGLARLGADAPINYVNNPETDESIGLPSPLRFESAAFFQLAFSHIALINAALTPHFTTSDGDTPSAKKAFANVH